MRTRQFIRKLHRWIGLIASLWLLLLASTGFLLQHSQQWQLDKKYISNATILNAYGIGEQFIAFKQDNHQLIQLDKQLIQNNKATIKLTEIVNSAIYHQKNWIIATDTQIIWINEHGQIIQSMDELDGLNLPINKIGKFKQDFIYVSNDKNYNGDSEIIQPSTLSSVQWPKISNDEKLKLKAIAMTSKNYLSFEQFIFDIHAGITTPSLLNDIAAISLITLSLTGIFLFFRKRKRNRQ